MFKYKTWANYCAITGINQMQRKVIIPEYINGFQVVHIDIAAFKNSTLEEVLIPDSILDILEEAFAGCANLKIVQVYKTKEPRRKIYLHKACFKNCENLEKIFVESDTLLSILVDSTRCFYNCKNLKTINAIFTSEIPGYTFYGCESLDNLVLKQESLGGICFAGTSLTHCKNLKNITLLGNISSYTPDNIWRRMNNMTIKCPSNINTTKLQSMGAIIQHISSIPLATDGLPKSITSIL